MATTWSAASASSVDAEARPRAGRRGPGRPRLGQRAHRRGSPTRLPRQSRLRDRRCIGCCPRPDTDASCAARSATWRASSASRASVAPARGRPPSTAAACLHRRRPRHGDAPRRARRRWRRRRCHRSASRSVPADRRLDSRPPPPGPRRRHPRGRPVHRASSTTDPTSRSSSTSTPERVPRTWWRNRSAPGCADVPGSAASVVRSAAPAPATPARRSCSMAFGAGRGHPIDDHRGDRLTGPCLERGFVAIVDLDHVEQRPHDTIDVGELRGAGAGTRAAASAESSASHAPPRHGAPLKSLEELKQKKSFGKPKVVIPAGKPGVFSGAGAGVRVCQFPGRRPAGGGQGAEPARQGGGRRLHARRTVAAGASGG